MIVELCSTTDVRDKDNRTPLHCACVGGCKDVVQYLVEEVDVGACSRLIIKCLPYRNVYMHPRI